MHHEKIHELVSLNNQNLNLEWQNKKMGRKTYEDLFLFISWDYVLNHKVVSITAVFFNSFNSYNSHITLTVK